MLIVFNKRKIYSYLIALCTVIVLFLVASTVTMNQTIFTASTPSRKLPIYQVRTEKKQVAFTMNCAWNADDIDKILEVLDKTNTKITFFMVGDWVDKYPEQVKKIAEKGHEIGNHSDTHPHVNQLSLEANQQEIKKCNEKIEKLIGRKPSVYRGPYGEYNDIVITAAEEENMQTIQWSLDTLDYTGLTGEEMWKRLEGKLTNGSIILSHNGTKHTADSLEMLLNNIKKQGYEIVKVSDLIYQNNSKIDTNGTQYQEE